MRGTTNHIMKTNAETADTVDAASDLLAELSAALQHSRRAQDVEANGRCNLTVLGACDAATDAILIAIEAAQSVN